MKSQFRRGFIFLASFPLLLLFLRADEKTPTPLGGIVPRGKPDISLQRAQICVSPGKISALYELVNNTSQDITTQILFPLPEYNYSALYNFCDLGDFKAWAEGKAVAIQTEVRAIVDGIERTEILNKLGITIEMFGFFDLVDVSEDDTGISRRYEVRYLTKEQKSKLIQLRIVEGDILFPRWSVQKLYQWTQRFPARQVARIRYEYSPCDGFTQMGVDNLRQELKDTCLSDDLLKKMKEAESRTEGWHWTGYVGHIRYLLTTLNSWKGPIRDFELIIDSFPFPRQWPVPRFSAFCWEGVTAQAGQHRYLIHERDFVPSKDLSVYYFW